MKAPNCETVVVARGPACAAGSARRVLQPAAKAPYDEAGLDSSSASQHGGRLLSSCEANTYGRERDHLAELWMDDGDPVKCGCSPARVRRRPSPSGTVAGRDDRVHEGAEAHGRAVDPPPTRFTALPEEDCRVDGRDTRVGSFDVRELHRTDGEIDRLWIVFEERCHNMDYPRFFGEIRFGQRTRPLAASPTQVTWPDQTFVGARGATVDVTFRQRARGRSRG